MRGSTQLKRPTLAAPMHSVTSGRDQTDRHRIARVADDDGPALVIGGAQDQVEVDVERAAERAVPAPRPLRGRTSRPTIAPDGLAASVPPAVRDAIGGLGPGRPLSSIERRFAAASFAQDFSHVRVHDDAAADRANRLLEADAFAVGSDIAFAAGQASPHAMAHELAHVACGDDGVRRRIRVEDDSAISLFPVFKDTYGLSAAFTSARGVYYVADRKDDGDLPGQMVQNIVRSERVFDLVGATQSGAEGSLARHVRARTGIVDYAREIRLGFKTGTPRVDSTKWEFFDEELKFRVDGIAEMVRNEDLPEEQKERKILQFSDEAIRDVFQDNIGRDEINAILDDVLQRSREHRAGGGETKDFPYATACWLATNIVMFGGARGELRSHRLDRKNADISQPTLQSWTDWIPGDWGYIRNTGTDAPRAGLEGENIVYLGDGSFWAHYDPAKPIESLERIFLMVQEWDGSAELVAERSYPAAGLRP